MTPTMRQILIPSGLVKRGLIAHYDFLQGADPQVLYDKSGYGNHGRLGSTTGADTNDPTITGQGFSFTTDDSIDCGNTANFTDSFTIQTLLRSSDATGNKGIFSKNPSSYTFTLFHLTGQANCAFYVKTASGTTAAGTMGDVAYADGKYNLLTASYDRKSNPRVKLQKNLNMPSVAIGYDEPIVASSGVFSIGQLSTSYFTGDMADMLIYNCALTDKEIKQNYRYLKRKLAVRGVLIA